jgi:CheY-like chemotaxis protein
MAQHNDKTRVVLLEDDALINMSTAALIEDMGYAVAPYLHIDQCFEAVRKQLPDLAVLDVNVAGGTSYDLAHWLHERRVAVIFLTGYETPSLDARFKDHPTCRKPCSPDDLKKLIAGAVASLRAPGT